MILFVADLTTAALATYIAYRVFQAWQSLYDRRLSLYFFGMILLAAALVLEAVVDIYLGLLRETEPGRFVARQEAVFRAVVNLLLLAALTPIAIAVTPAMFYAIAPLFILAPVNAILAIYIAAVMFIKTAERKAPPYVPLAFTALTISLLFPISSNMATVSRLLTAVFLALGIWHGRGAPG